LYPFRVLLPVTALLYLIRIIREKRNPWKEATFIQRASYVLCAILAVYSTLSLGRAIDFSFTAPLWITLCFDLVFFALVLELCSDRTVFIQTAWCALLSLLIQIVLGIEEVFHGGIFSHRYNTNWNFAFLGRLHQSPLVASGNTNTSYTGIKYGSKTDYRYPSENNAWELMCYDFSLNRTINVEISLGFTTSAAVGAANNTLLYIDNVRLLSKDTNVPDDIDMLQATSSLVDVYSVQGLRLRTQVPLEVATEGLPKGIYMVGNQKVLVGGN